MIPSSAHSPQRAALAALLALTASLPLLATPAQTGAAASPLKVLTARASSTLGDHTANKAIDGILRDDSRWVSQASPSPAWLELDLGPAQKLAGIHLYSGYRNADPLQSFVVQFWRDGAWRDIPSAALPNNRATALALPFDDTVDVTTDKLRLWITASHQHMARVLEIVVWPAQAGNLPPLPPPPAQESPPPQPAPLPLIYLNQSGFNLGQPKRFTAPTLPNGTPFEVRPAHGGPAVFHGALQGHIGDFTALNPTSERDYVVAAGTNASVPFRIGPWWLERVTYRNAVDFMVDSRHYVGNDRTPCGGSFGWRDDHHFGWELHTLVPQFLSNPSAYERMTRQIHYEKPHRPKLWGALLPYREDAPDVVKLIHWGADVIVSQGTTHELLKAQLAYFLYAWPWLQEWLPAQNYQTVRDFTFQHWTNAACDRTYPYDESAGHDLLALKTQLGSTKGALPPGFSIEPNLLLHAVAQREHRSDAGGYLEAAAQQAAWMIAHLVWSHFDHGFGRNPVGRHFSYEAPREIEGVEHGWFSFYPGGIGRLADARFVLDGSPKDGHYPYHPERGNYGWTEGWVQFNTAFNISLAYLAWAHSHLELRPAGNHLIVQLEAPLNFDYDKVETGKVWVNTASGDQEIVAVTEDSPNARTLTGRLRLASTAAARPGDGILQAAPGARIEAGYGYGYLGRRVTLQP